MVGHRVGHVSVDKIYSSLEEVDPDDDSSSNFILIYFLIDY